MSPTLRAGTVMQKSSSPDFVKISSKGQIESIMGAKQISGVSAPILSRLKQAKSHYEELGAHDVYAHNCRVLCAAAEGKIADLQATEEDVLSLKVVDQILYHSISSDLFLPNSVQFSTGFMQAFTLQRQLNDLDSTKFDRSGEYVRLLNDPSNDLTALLVALYTRIADMMTIHAPETKRASKTILPGVFPLHSSWRTVQRAMAEPMLKVYCPIADWGGQTHAYRQMRDHAVFYQYPEQFLQLSKEVQKYSGAVANTNVFLARVLQKMAKKLGLNVIIAEDYQKVSKLFSEVGPNTVVVALKPFKGVGGLLHKSIKRDVPVEKIHDWSGLTVITDNEQQMYDVVTFLQNGGVRSAAKSVGVADLYIHDPTDYARNPKQVTNYQSVHIDVVTSSPLMMPAEFIVRTLDMHKKADEGEACHDGYKGSPLVNGERARLMQRLAEITKSHFI